MTETIRSIQQADQLAPYLRSLRKSRGLTQSALGKMLGVSAARIAAMEQRPGVVSTARLIELLGLLGARVYIGEGKPERAAADEKTRRLPAGEW